MKNEEKMNGKSKNALITEQILSDLKKGLVKSRELEKIFFKSLFSEEASKWSEAIRISSDIRRKLTEEKMNTQLSSIESHFTSIAKPYTTGIELQIGGIAIPLGLTDPILIRGDYTRNEKLPLPLATNEAALIAGMNRGIRTINASGGIRCIICYDGMTRAPVIECPSIDYAHNLKTELESDQTLFQKLKTAAEENATVSQLKKLQVFQQSKFLWLRFVFQTGDAMGMNSVTRYSADAVDCLISLFPEIKLIALSGNMCTDKKSTHINILLNRGKHVETEVEIPSKVLQKIRPHITPRVIERLNFVKNWMGSSLSGTIAGFNANAGNAIAALFAATGQDLAQTTESSSCFVYTEDRGNSLYLGVSLPSLEVATIGGGTETPTAQEGLRLLQCNGKGKNPGENALKLAEIAGAAVTAQELNLLITLASGSDLAESHMKLARGT
ncbi:MAG: 3-hydroxy-3-methylglutaryl-CoA reductase [Candidatus Hodarchaeales archaeon]|jgi:hydroxymethylglutaryl-CoA reductase (NADPH)